MTRPKRVVLKESSLESVDEAHELLARELDFPDYYGANLDALEDCLAEVCTPTRIVVKRGEGEPKPWFDDLVEVIRQCAQRSCYVGCTIRES
ncbi:MAG: barstar family protein [Atopobiaceae bacterium]|nr:barstar family protein [Atopobiaceae bacterium]